MTRGFDDLEPATNLPADDLDLAEYDRYVDERLLAENSLRAYASDWNHFLQWCETFGHRSLPAAESTVLAYLHYWGDPELAEMRSERGDRQLKWSTLQRRVVALRLHHRADAVAFPAKNLDGEDRLPRAISMIRRAQRSPVRSATAISEGLLLQMVHSLGDTPRDVRARAILLVGFLGALRRSELCELNLDDLTFTEEGMILDVRFSKTDQRGDGERVYIPFTRHTRTCAVRATKAWLAARRGLPIRPGDEDALFLSLHHRGSQRLRGTTIRDEVRRAVTNVGEDPSNYSAHSLRSGLATSASRAQAPLRTVMRQTRHSSMVTLDPYVQEGIGFEDNPVHFLRSL